MSSVSADSEAGRKMIAAAERRFKDVEALWNASVMGASGDYIFRANCNKAREKEDSLVWCLDQAKTIADFVAVILGNPDEEILTRFGEWLGRQRVLPKRGRGRSQRGRTVVLSQIADSATS